MGFAISTRRMYNVRSFEDADRLYTKQKKPGGRKWTENERPLEDARAHHKRLVLNDDGSYSCVLYGTSLITYYPTGRIAIKHHVSSSSINFFRMVSPYTVTISREFIEIPNQWVLPETGRVVLEPVKDDSAWRVVSGAAQRVRATLNVAATKLLRAQLEDFFAWFEITDKMVTHWGRDPLQYVAVVVDPENYQALGCLFAAHKRDKAKFRAALYKRNKLFDIDPIPNTEPPKTSKYSYSST